MQLPVKAGYLQTKNDRLVAFTFYLVLYTEYTLKSKSFYLHKKIYIDYYHVEWDLVKLIAITLIP